MLIHYVELDASTCFILVMLKYQSQIWSFSSFHIIGAENSFNPSSKIYNIYEVPKIYLADAGRRQNIRVEKDGAVVLEMLPNVFFLTVHIIDYYLTLIICLFHWELQLTCLDLTMVFFAP